jgi:nucleotide-binding universal stress UspA family protein
MHSGPVVVGFDGTSASERALREAAALIAPRPALVVVVWEAGRAFEAATLPVKALEMPPAALDVRAAFEAETAAYQAAQRLAEQGAALARQADGLAVADDVTVADTLVRLARELDGQAVVIGAAGHGEPGKLALASTLKGVLRRAPCPVLVCGGRMTIRTDPAKRSVHGHPSQAPSARALDDDAPGTVGSSPLAEGGTHRSLAGLYRSAGPIPAGPSRELPVLGPGHRRP